MLLSALYALACLLLDLVLLRCGGNAARDVELLALRYEIRVLRRTTTRPAQNPGDRLLLAALGRWLARTSWHVFPVRPETLLRWHRELVRRRWVAFGRRRGPGRTPLPTDVRELVVRLATENPGWGHRRIRGELLKLGHEVSATAIRSVLRRRGIPPVPRPGGLAWGSFLRAQARGVLACDFFAVETVRLQVLYVLFFIELRTRRVFLAGCPEQPTAACVTQQARKVAWDLAEAGLRPGLLLRDRDAKFAPSFDAVFASEGLRAVRAPVRSPRANAVAERWVGTVRRECLDRLLILAGAASRPSYGSSSRTTTRPGRTARSTCARHWPADSPSTRLGRSSDRIGSVDSSTSTSVLPRERYRPSKGTPQPPNGGRNARRWGPTRPSPQAVGTGS